MKDTIRNRITRIITGTANSIVSKIEGLAPEMIMEQAIQEIDSAVDEVRAELGRITAQKHHVTKVLAKLNNEHNDIGDQLGTAMQQGRNDLAQAALARQIDIEDQLPALENQLSDLSAQEKELDQAITGLLAKRREMEDELFSFKEECKRQAASASTESGNTSGNSPASKAARAENAFNRVLQDATGVRHAAIKAGDAERSKLLELSELSRKAKIDARFKELEAKFSSK